MLKYNSKDQLNSKLNILRCCIADKGLKLANSIALALGNNDCLQKELNLLNAYYKALECYYPYDCIYITDTPQELMQITKQMLPGDLPNIGTGALDTHFGVNNLTVIFESVLNSATSPIAITNNSLIEVAEQIVEYINTNTNYLGYTAEFDGESEFTFTVNTCNLVFTDETSPQMGFTLVFNSPFALFQYYDFTPENTSVCATYIENCCNIKVINEQEELYECIENCLTDKQAEQMIRHAISMCDCCTEININNELLNT
jgi:hypothetical protein